MKHYCKNSLALIVVLLLLTQSGCQEQARTSDVSKAEGGPRITFEDTVYDFGEVSSSRKYTGQFKFTNTGSGILKINDVKKCCGVVVKLDKEELAPGESGALKVEYTTGPRSGSMDRSIRVYSNDETKPKSVLTIKAHVIQKVSYKPPKVDLLFNNESIDCPKIMITSLDKQPFSIKSFQSTGDVITADVDSSVELTQFVLQPNVDPDKHKKRQSGLISIDLTHPELDNVTIRFRTKQRFELKPTGVFLLNPTPQEPSINKVSVVSNYDEDFEIESTSSEKGTAKVISQRAIADGYRLDVQITPPPPDETRGFTDVVNVLLKGGETLKIKCYVRYTDQKD
jgi:hypothetical protein